MSGGANPTRIIEARTVPEPVPVPGAHFRRRRSHQMAGGQSTALDQWSGASNWPNMSKPCHHRESRQFVHPLATATSTGSKDSAEGRAEAGRSRLGVARGGRSGESGGAKPAEERCKAKRGTENVVGPRNYSAPAYAACSYTHTCVTPQLSLKCRPQPRTLPQPERRTKLITQWISAASS